jgi:hypothetical protein
MKTTTEGNPGHTARPASDCRPGYCPQCWRIGKAIPAATVDACPFVASHAVAPAAPGLRTEDRGGVLHVIGRDGVRLGPVSSPRIAASYGRALQNIGLTA